ncbi:MAG: ABC transporter permease [Lachnospiraceae bacterium]|nr:ABC transporter permease [Lachnospiraceae bacterium]
MQSKISFFNKTIFFKNLTQYWLIELGYTVLNLLMMPVVILSYISEYGRYYDVNGQEYANTINMNIKDTIAGNTNCLLAVVMGILMAVALFHYMYNNRSSNMIHAFPVTRCELYFTNIITGIVMLILPIIITASISAPIIVNYSTEGLRLLAYWVLFEIMYSLFFFGLAVFVGMFTGQTIGALVFYGIFNLMYVGVATIIKGIEAFFGYGLSAESPDVNYPLFPLYYLIENTGINSNYTYDDTGLSSYSIEIVGVKTGIAFAVVGLILLIVAYVVYIKRQLETVGDWITVSWAKPFFRWGIGIGGGTISALIITSLFATDSEIVFVIEMFICSIIYFMLAQMLILKSFKIKKQSLIEGCACALVFSIIFIVADSCGYWRENYIPDSSEIEAVCIRGGYLDNNIVLKNNPEAALEFHENCLVAKGELEGASSENSFNMDLVYLMKDGKVVRRSYLLPEGNEAAENIFKELQTAINEPEIVLESLCTEYYKDNTITSMSCSVRDGDGMVPKDVSEKNYKEVYDAVIKDIEDGNIVLINDLEDYINNSGDDTYANYLSINFHLTKPTVTNDSLYYDNSRYLSDAYASIQLNPDCKNTIEALIDVGVLADESDIVKWSDVTSEY